MHRGHYYTHRRHHHPRPMFPILFGLLFLFFILKGGWILFLLLPIAFVVFAVMGNVMRQVVHATASACEADYSKRKNDDFYGSEKPKNDQSESRYARTADGDWVEII